MFKLGHAIAIAEALVKANPAQSTLDVQGTVRNITGLKLDGRTIAGVKHHLFYRASGLIRGHKLAGLKHSRNYQAGKKLTGRLPASLVTSLAA